MGGSFSITAMAGRRAIQRDGAIGIDLYQPVTKRNVKAVLSRLHVDVLLCGSQVIEAFFALELVNRYFDDGHDRFMQ